MASWMKHNRIKIEKELVGSPKWYLFSPVIYLQYKKALPVIQQNVKGNLIDIGCGYMPFHDQITPLVETYDGLDLFPRTTDVRYVSDVQNMPEIPDSTYNSAICLEVLEHVPDPFQAVREIQRILKPQGKLILTVPHLSRLHDEPHDYYRYTNHGLLYLLTQAGFTNIQVIPRGSLFSFLGHQISTVLLTLVWSVPILKGFTYWLNGWAVTRFCVWLDFKLDKNGVFALGYVAVAKKIA